MPEMIFPLVALCGAGDFFVSERLGERQVWRGECGGTDGTVGNILRNAGQSFVEKKGILIDGNGLAAYPLRI